VTLVIANTGLCSGVLLNNVAGDGTPYVLTARHCENGNADGGDPSAASGVSAYFDAVTPCGQLLASIFDTETAVLSGNGDRTSDGGCCRHRASERRQQS
jgi:hypothetical protein